MLELSGRLNLKAGGPGVFPPLPPGVVTRGGWKKEADPSEGDRRSVYVFVRRNTRYPMFEVFDMPDTHESCALTYMHNGRAERPTITDGELIKELFA
jgi:Protein of unknown function (DUF1553)